MKKLLAILPYVMIGGLFIFTTACDSDDDSDETCKSAIQDFGSCSSADISVCSDNDLNSYYLYKGDEKTEEELEAICFTAGASQQAIMSAKMELDALTIQLLDDVRAASVCN